MIVTLDLEHGKCFVQREPQDIRYPNNVNGESRLMRHVARVLREQGHDVIKKLMWKDGHLVDDNKYYIRTRKFPILDKPEPSRFMIYDPNWTVRLSTESFNEEQLILDVEH